MLRLLYPQEGNHPLAIGKEAGGLGAGLAPTGNQIPVIQPEVHR
jgi:hypothetical protein